MRSAVAMPPPLLATKLQPPRMRRGLVSRQYLVQRLRDGRDRRLTLVCAPAGYGKTTLLAQWDVEDRERTPFVWLSLDDGDSDPVRLWNQLVFALHEVHPPAGAGSSRALSAGPRALAERVVPLLINELVDAPPLVVILEDWHKIRSPVCDETMRIFVERLPERVQLVISSRSDPGLPLARLRAHGELWEVRAEHLRLDSGEAAELFRGAELELDSDDVARLTSRTEGWAAGLHLASLALKEQQDPQAFVAAFSGDSRNVLDFLAHDVLDAVAPELRSFLLRSSVLDELSAPLCDAVLEISSSAALLSEAERSNLFLVKLDESRGLYRYHQLFADMLRRELAAEEPDLPSHLHARASEWFEREGRLEAAIEHAIAGRNLLRASDLVTSHAREYWSSGRIATLARWLEALSWPEAFADPQLAFVRTAVAALVGAPAEELERWLEVVSGTAHDGPPANGLHSLESGVALARALYLTKGIAAATEAAYQAIAFEQPPSTWRRPALTALGQALYLAGRPEEAREPLEEARRLPDTHGQAPSAATVLAYLALIELDAGRLGAAERLAREGLGLLEQHHVENASAATNAYLALGSALGAGTDLHGALVQLERAVELSAPLSPAYWHAHALLRLAEVRHRLGHAQEAHEALESARFELDALPDGGMLEVLLAEREEQLHERPRREGFLGEPLSESELRVLRQLVDGRSLAEVAKTLFLSLNTVKTHRRTIYRKLGASTREEALERAAELELTDPRHAESPG